MKIISIMFLIFLLTGCNNENSEKTNQYNLNLDESNYINSVDTFKEEYESLNGQYSNMQINLNNEINYLKNVYEFLTKETGVVYFGRATCPYCRDTLPYLLEASLKYDTYIHYVNSNDLKVSEDYSKVLSYLDEFLEHDEEGNPILYVPHIFFVKDGQVVAEHLGTTTTEKYEEYMELLK